MRGAGDAIEVGVRVASLGAVPRIAKALRCRCQERRRKLNAALPAKWARD